MTTIYNKLTGRRKIHYTFPDKELVEEYDVHSGLLLGKYITLSLLN
jgi:hypothetical protein